MKLGKTKVIVFSGCIALTAIYLALFGSDTKVTQVESIPKARPEETRRSFPEVDAAEKRSSKIGKAAPPAAVRGHEGAVPAADRKLIEETLVHMVSSLKELEVKNSVTIYDSDPDFGSNETSSDRAHIVMIKIPAPSEEQLRDFWREFSQGVGAFPPDSASRKEMLDRGYRLFNEFTKYPKPVKIVRYIEFSDHRIGDFYEWYLADEQMVMPNKDGNLPIPVVPEAVFRHDSKLGSENSWATARYSHLVTVD